jgi:hypothetical protein
MKTATRRLLLLPAFLLPAFLLPAFLLPAAPAAAADLVLEESAGFMIDAQVNGRPVRLRVATSAPGYIILNPTAAQRVGLRASMTRAQTFVGPVRLRGSTKAADVTIAGTKSQRRLLWWDRNVTEGADGIVSAADIPYDRVTFRMAPAQAGERTLQLPMEWDRSSGLTHRLAIGGQQVSVQVTAHLPDTIGTAAAGALLAQLNGGTWSGEMRVKPLNFGVMRPVRPLALGRPLSIAGLGLARLLVRTQDHRGNAQLPAEAGADPDEIIVTANTGKQRPRYILGLGRDWLAPCSSMTLDNRTRVLALSCRPAG